MPWDPAQYLKFSGERVQPPIDLLARIPAERPHTVVDLGCGAGNMFPLFAARWPEARLVGVDNSPDMLARARIDNPTVSFVEADLSAWAPTAPVDVMFSNACFQWLDRHEHLLPRLLSHVAPGGWFAVQMPRSLDMPMATCMTATIQAGPWRSILEPGRRQRTVAPPEEYWRLLSPHAAALTFWETEYMHVLSGENPVAEFAKGSGLKQLLDRLEEPMRSQFEVEARRRLAEAYPKEADGRTLFKMRRLFFLAQPKI